MTVYFLIVERICYVAITPDTIGKNIDDYLLASYTLQCGERARPPWAQSKDYGYASTIEAYQQRGGAGLFSFLKERVSC